MKKKRFTRLISLASAVLLTFSLIACGNATDSQTGSAADEGTQTADGATQTADETTADETTAADAEEGSTADAGDGPIEIVWLAPGTEADFTEAGKVNYECLEAYNNSQDKVHVSYEFYANQADLFEVIQMKMAAGTSEYDVLSVDSPMVAAYVNNGWLLPLDDYFTAEALTAPVT